MQRRRRCVLNFIEAPDNPICGSFIYGFFVKALEQAYEIKASEDTEMMWIYFKDTGLFRTGVLDNIDLV
jgi:hypothetical protein